MRPLTPKQQRFVDEYLIDLNATQAAIRAGYSAKTAEQQGHRLLRNAQVSVAVQAGRAKTAKKLEITRERILQELARIAFADVRALFTWDEERACYVPSRDLSDDEAAAISEIQTETTRRWEGRGDDAEPVDTIKLKIKTYDKKGALELLARHHGMLIDKHEVTGANGGPVEMVALSDAELAARAKTQANRIAALAAHTNGNGANGNGRK